MVSFFVNTSKTKFRETKAGKGGAPLINGVVLLEKAADGTANERSVMVMFTRCGPRVLRYVPTTYVK